MEWRGRAGVLAVAGAMLLAGCVTPFGSMPRSAGGEAFPAPAAGMTSEPVGRASPPPTPSAAGPIVPAGAETPDQRYRSLLLDFTNGARVQLHYRVYETGGRTAMCGYLTADASMRDHDATGRWFETAVVLLGDHGFGTGSFLKLHSAQDAAARRPNAQCVESALAWNPQRAGAPVAFRSGPTSRGF